MRIVSLALILTLVLFSIANGQEKCATVPYMKNLFEKRGIPEKTEQFEEWLQQKIEKRKQTLSNLRVQAASAYQVPVVVHIIHNGQSVGIGQNLSDEQIISQITVLNNDFKRLNADAVNTPGDFIGVAGSIDIDFVLAKSDPDGLPTTGIVRMDDGDPNKTSWNASSDADMALLKSKSYWPAEDYLNIWVTDLGSNYLGLAQYPVSDLPGLESYQNGLSETDGVVIDYTVFGLGSSDPTYNLGRTTTHEMGHFFGLRHIWGDDSGCINSGSGSDYVDDTPNQADETYDCPTHPQADCGTVKMFQNYLDYTDDVCMNLFTQGQIVRMEAILASSPRRASLLNSPGLVEPSGLGEDLRITSIASPSPITCSSTALKFTVQNIGSPIITKFKVSYTIDSGNPTTTSFDNLSIISGAFFDVTIPITLEEGNRSFYFQVHSPNGYADANPTNSDTLLNVLVNDNQDFLPLLEQFDKSSTNWVVFNPANGTVWDGTDTNFNNSAYFKAYNNPSLGEQSWLVSPILDFSNIKTSSILFDYSYRYAPGGNRNDRLTILASTGCSNGFDINLFDNAGQNLSNIAKNEEWFPYYETDWKINYKIKLNSLVGNSQVRLAFVAENHNGNNIFIDNIEFFLSDNPLPYGDEIDLYTIYWVGNGIADITFNLPERQPVGFTVLDVMGRSLFDTTLPNVLNQTFRIPIGLSAAGLYLIRLQIGSKYYLTKIYLSP